ncbi:MAG TPA: FAD binding domain-containing protein [Ignavibacteriales bacterium]|nr:FAD binding domain-containing protein [Ignavibacteriales bacterium]
MLPENLEWEFPSSAEKAAQMIRRPGTVLHGGGTRILKTCPATVKRLVDTGALGLNYINFIDNSYYIGSGATFSDIVKYSKAGGRLTLLGEALSNAASTPLRNRITLGGSLKDFPIWSSLYAPLIALKARVEILRNKPEIYTIEEYVTSGIIKTRHLIKHVIIDEEANMVSGVKRFSMLRFEYPLFTVAASLNVEGGIIEDARLVITGVRGRFKRFLRAEKMLIGKELNDIPVESIITQIAPGFTKDYRFSAGYKDHAARIYFIDLLNELKGGAK